MDKLLALKKHFGYDAFRPGQEALIDALLSGRDVLGVMPTGAGKSVCYQLPALLLGGMTLVISPLISLMKDQVAALCQAGIAAAFINSSLDADAYRRTLARARKGEYKLLFVAPERLASEGFAEVCRDADIALVAVDEAHCVSQWGQDFRPHYLAIAEFVASLPRRPAVGAFTATATEDVREDIARLLCLDDALCLTTGFDRPNLFFEVVKPKSRTAYVQKYVAAHAQQSGIVYCLTRKSVEAVCESLRRLGVAATRYHAGLSDEERRVNQDAFVYDEARVMVATNAFGMGIDKSNVGYVLHCGMPKSPESYYQEAGRAGRDGRPAACVLLFSQVDVVTARYFIANPADNEALTAADRPALLRRDTERLGSMTAYCNTTGCLRGHLLAYFGQAHEARCGHCGNCTGDFTLADMTIPAQKALSAVARIERQYASGLGAALIVRMLCGSRDQRVLSLGLDKLPTYGALREMERSAVRALIDHLLAEGYIALSADAFPVVRLMPRAREVLFDGAQVLFRQTQADEPPAMATSRGDRRTAKSVDTDGGPLFDALRALRARIAQAEGVPAYIVFSNATLHDMADKRPRTMAAMMAVSGVGEVKAGRYGQRFIEAIAAFEAGEA